MIDDYRHINGNWIHLHYLKYVGWFVTFVNVEHEITIAISEKHFHFAHEAFKQFLKLGERLV